MLKLNQNYSDYTDETDANYPEGKAINASSSESFDGTPLLAEFMNDVNAAHIAMYEKAYGNRAGIDGEADTQKASQFADAVAKYTDDHVKNHTDQRGFADGVHGATADATPGQIATRDEFGNLKVGTAIDDGDAINKAGAEAMVKNLALYAQPLFDSFIPEIYVQFPGMKDPNEKYNNDFISSTWEEIKFGGVFFRSEGGDALPYTGEFKCVVAGNSISLSSSDAQTMQYETLLATYAANKLIVIAGGEYRKVTAWNRTTHTITLDSAFTDTSNITSVLIGQSEGLPNITGGVISYSMSSNVSKAGAFNDSYLMTAVCNTGNNVVQSCVFVDFKASNSNKIYRDDCKSVTPVNLAIKYWKRIA